MKLQETIDTMEALVKQLKTLDGQVADVLNGAAENMGEKHACQMVDLEKKHAAEVERREELHAEKIEEIEGKLEEAQAVFVSIEAETVGILKTESLILKMLFDKLADHWENLSRAQMETIEGVLDGKEYM